MTRNICQKIYIYPFGHPTLSRQKEREKGKEKLTMDENIRKVFEKHFNNKLRMGKIKR